jgi:hypothetical protein
MQLTIEQLESITEMGTAAMTPKQVAYALGFKIAEFIDEIKNDESPINAAYFKGLYSNEFQVRKSIMQLARNGSSPAQAQALKLIDIAKANSK